MYKPYRLLAMLKFSCSTILTTLTAIAGIATTAQADTSTHRQHYTPVSTTISVRESPPRLVMNNLELAIYQYINQYRQYRHLPPLKIDPIASAQARAHSEKMAQKRYLSHDGFRQRINAINPQLTCARAAENVTVNLGYHQPDFIALKSWLESPKHHRNIIGRYHLTGIGVAQNTNGEYYFTQIFIRQQQ